MSRHALVAAAPGIGVGRPADARLLGVVELAAPRGRQEVHAGASELDREVRGILHRAAALDALLGEEPAAQRIVGADRLARGAVDLQRQAHAGFARAAITVGAVVGRRQERRHRVGVGVVQLHPVEAGALRPQRCGGEQLRQHLRKVADMRQVHVGDALAQAVVERLQLARRQHLSQLGMRQTGEVLPHARLGPVTCLQQLAVTIGDLEEALKVLVRLGPAPDRQEVDDSG